MAETSTIEWTEATWNPITGCSIISPGCRDCYAMKLAGSRLRNHPSRKGLTKVVNGQTVWTGEVRFNDGWLGQPLQWRRPRKVFVCAHGDLFHEAVPDEWIDSVFAIMGQAQQHTFQVLTKRPERMREWAAKAWVEHHLCGGGGCNYCGDHDGRVPWKFFPFPNVWLGTSVERQDEADARLPYLINTAAAVRFISAEPLIGPVLLQHRGDVVRNWLDKGGLDWVIVGGESGARPREMDPAWARDLRDQCGTAGVAFFMKQMSDKAEIPADLMVREFPLALPRSGRAA